MGFQIGGGVLYNVGGGDGAPGYLASSGLYVSMVRRDVGVGPAGLRVGADPEVEVSHAGVKVGVALLALVTVLEVFLEVGDVDDLAHGELLVVYGRGEEAGVVVRAIACHSQSVLHGRHGTKFCGLTGRDLVVVGCFGAIVGWDGTSTPHAIKGEFDPLSGGTCALRQGISGREHQGHKRLVQCGRLHLAS